MLWIAGFIWDEENLSHIARHHVAPEEVEEALAAAPVVLRSRTSVTSATGERRVAGSCSSCTFDGHAVGLESSHFGI